MKKFKVHIVETLSRDICVEAKDYDEARRTAGELCNSHIVVLNDADLCDTKLCNRSIDAFDIIDNVEFDKVYTRKDIKKTIIE